MTHKKIPRPWSALLLGASLAAGAAGAHAAAAMDATLALIAGAPAATAARHLQRSAEDAAADTVAVTIRFSGSPFAALQALGVRLGSTSGNVVTAQVPRARLRQVAQVPGVEFIEASRPLTARLSLSVPATGASQLRSGAPLHWSGATGQGVIVGIVDDGLDFRHQDFRNADGTTRLLSLWDMRAGAQGTPPAGFSYGSECSAAQLNTAIVEGVGSAACAQPSSGNHGTHVGGIAAGNGQATGNGMAAFRHVGMAPMADIISANAIARGVGASNAVLDGIQYIKARAQALGRPAVVNLSLGSYSGSRDGTSNYEVALSNAVGAGFLITGAAGNEGMDPIRAQAELAQGQTVAVGYRIPAVEAAQQVEFWYPGSYRWSVRASNGQCTTDWVPADTPSYTRETACGEVAISNNGVNPLNGDRQATVSFAPLPGRSHAGQWSVQVQAVQGSGTLSMIGGQDGNGGVFTDHVNPVTTQILTDTCTATQVLCVGAYVTRQQWQTLGGQPAANTGHGAIGEVANFSSRGPRRSCSDAARCPLVAKPEILAPGAMIISALGQDASDSRTDSTVEADGQHIAYNGTSMATPHVTGAIALLLQKNPGLTGPQVRQLLLSNLQRTSFTPASLPAFDPAVPNPAGADAAWGYGIMDAAKAYAATPAAGGTTGTIVPSVVGDARSLTLGATITPAASEAGAPLQAYVVALLPGGSIFTLGQGQWQPLAAGVRAYGPISGGQPLSVQVFDHLPYAGLGLAGTAIFVGYGRDEVQMIQQQKFKLIYTMTE